MAELGIALIGTGSIADYHLAGLKAVPGAETRVVVGRDAAKAASLAARFGIAASSADPASALARADVDAVIIATPDDTHEALAGQAAARGKAVMLQKPMATDAAYEECARALLEDAEIDALIVSMVPLTPALLTGADEIGGEGSIARRLARLAAETAKPAAEPARPGFDLARPSGEPARPAAEAPKPPAAAEAEPPAQNWRAASDEPEKPPEPAAETQKKAEEKKADEKKAEEPSEPGFFGRLRQKLGL